MESLSSSEGIVGQSRVTMRLLELTRTTNYELVQENGQRRLTAPESSTELKERVKGSEIFIGRLPRDCYEDEIMPILQRIGRLLELRLMLDFSGSTRGYAFALFENSTIARQACRVLDGYEIRPGHKIGVVKSIDNCRLFFGGVPKDKNKTDFLVELGKILDGITDIYMYPNAQDRTQNRGFIFVEFKDHRSAAMARRKLIPGRVVLWNHEIAVDWADPEPGEPIDDDIMETVTALFVRNLSLDTPHQPIREIFQKTTGIPILKLKKINHFAFIHYENRQLAQYALNIMTQPGGIAERQNWEICWAKPMESCKMIQRRISISEPVTNIRGFENRPILKKSIHRKVYKKNNQETRTANLCMDVDHRQLLESFVAENLSAACHFECCPTPDQSRHICKVTITAAAEVLFEFEGGSFRSQQKAVESAASEVYNRIRQAIENHELWLPCTDPYSRRSLSSHKFEACR